MYYEPDTLWGRTVDGDREIASPTNGLSLVQRRMLADLGQPRSFAHLVTRYRMEAPKLERELIRLADARLVAFRRPGADQPRTAPRLHWPQAIPASPSAADSWKPGPAAYGIAIGLGFLAVLVVFLWTVIAVG